MKTSRFLPKDVSLYTTDGISFTQETETDLMGLMPGEVGKRFIGYLAEQSGDKIPLNGESAAFGTYLVKALTAYAVKSGVVDQENKSTYDLVPYLALVGALAARPNENKEAVETYCEQEYAGISFDNVVEAATAMRNEVQKKVAEYTSRKNRATPPPVPVKPLSDAAAA